MQNNNPTSYIYYGTHAKASEVKAFLLHVLANNREQEQSGLPKTPICIWGKHGVGKTALVQALAQEQGWQFAYIAPAQFEEMGDLLGMPTIENGKTVFKTPAWVPTQTGPGILLIDDVNRADDRILRGIMQLLQRYQLVSWQLPPQWDIVLTANPDGGDYSVTPMDDALLTRMMHVTLDFDLKEWAKWAENHQIDPRGIEFVLAYPELITGGRTTPRSLVQFFESIKNIPDLASEFVLVRMLADACLDLATSAAFLSFVQQDLKKLVAPEIILHTTDFNREVKLPLERIVKQQNLRVDLLAVIVTRLLIYLQQHQDAIQKHQMNNLKNFLQLDFLPGDLRMGFVRDLMDSAIFKSMAADPLIANLLVDMMG
ncbi:MAG TPA: AAA family ATPase [Saprospiraceae bacterium]|nr:AAA family ATPase [Saprospiraceae bacterium]HMQ82195.1 AAA family ATPase [Saprospiraceae bacterium]